MEVISPEAGWEKTPLGCLAGRRKRALGEQLRSEGPSHNGESTVWALWTGRLARETGSRVCGAGARRTSGAAEVKISGYIAESTTGWFGPTTRAESEGWKAVCRATER